MTRQDVERYIRTEKGNAHSVDDLVDIAHAAWDAQIDPTTEGIKTAELEGELGLQLDYGIGTCLNHLEEIELFESRVPSGPDWYVISVRLDKVINGDVDDVAEDDIEAVIQHMQDDDPVGRTEATAATDGARTAVRSVLSSAFDVTPSTVEQHLRGGDPVERLNTAVEEIEDHPDLTKRETYGRIIFRRGALRWRLTKRAVNLYQK
jgi:hypothetical protein